MKALLITILVVILLIFGYNKYADYQRFSLDNYEYETLSFPTDSDINDSFTPDQQTLMLYHQKVAQLNGHVITQWSSNKIDVRNPKDDDAQTLAARGTYDKLLGEVKFLENKLQSPSEDTTAENRRLEKKKRHDRIKELFTTTANNDLRIGSKGALVFELQKLLNVNGATIPEDGNFQKATFEALRSFEERKKLFPDGRLDMLTLEFLLEE